MTERARQKLRTQRLDCLQAALEAFDAAAKKDKDFWKRLAECDGITRKDIVAIIEEKNA
jgi:hypothetical protein